MVSLMLLEVDAKVGHGHELRPDERSVGAENLLTCTKVKIVTKITCLLTCCITDLHTDGTGTNVQNM